MTDRAGKHAPEDASISLLVDPARASSAGRFGCYTRYAGRLPSKSPSKAYSSRPQFLSCQLFWMHHLCGTAETGPSTPAFIHPPIPRDRERLLHFRQAPFHWKSHVAKLGLRSRIHKRAPRHGAAALPHDVTSILKNRAYATTKRQNTPISANKPTSSRTPATSEPNSLCGGLYRGTAWPGNGGGMPSGRPVARSRWKPNASRAYF